MKSGKRSERIEVKQRPRILLVDDDINVKKFLFGNSINWEQSFYTLSTATGVFWMARREEPTVIVADYCMPNGDAECLLRRLRSVPETRSIPVVVHSGRRLSTNRSSKGSSGALTVSQAGAHLAEDVRRRGNCSKRCKDFAASQVILMVNCSTNSTRRYPWFSHMQAYRERVRRSSGRPVANCRSFFHDADWPPRKDAQILYTLGGRHIEPMCSGGELGHDSVHHGRLRIVESRSSVS